MSVSFSGSGQVISQVITTFKSDTYSGSNTTYTNVTGMTVSITPRNSANKILVIINVNVGINGTKFYGCAARNGTPIGLGDTASNRPRASFEYYTSDAYTAGCNTIVFLDSPSTTSAVTYSLQEKNQGSGTNYVNRSYGWRDTTGYDAATASSITVMEIAYA